MPEARMISNVKSYDKFVMFCEEPKQPNSYPCAVKITQHKGYGHCEDWETAHIVEALSTHTEAENKIYLAGVIKGMVIE